MRLWTLHPRYLDARGLTAVWREALLAQRVLRGLTRGYRSHPQLERFRAQPDPVAAIAAYLAGVLEEATARGYRFDAARIVAPPSRRRIDETEGQLRLEWRHLLAKLAARAPERADRFRRVDLPEAHPLFRVVPGARREWERAAAG